MTTKTTTKNKLTIGRPCNSNKVDFEKKKGCQLNEWRNNDFIFSLVA